MLHLFNRKLRFPNIRHAVDAIGASEGEAPEKRLDTLAALRGRVDEVFRGLAQGEWTYHANRTLGFGLPGVALGIAAFAIAATGSGIALLAGAAMIPLSFASMTHSWRASSHVFTLLKDLNTLKHKIDRDIVSVVAGAPELVGTPAYLSLEKDLRPAFNDEAYYRLVDDAGSGPSFETPPPPRHVPQHIEKAP